MLCLLLVTVHMVDEIIDMMNSENVFIILYCMVIQGIIEVAGINI